MKLVTQGKVLKALHMGYFIMVEHQLKPEPRTVYRLSNNQKIVKRELVELLVNEGLIQPNNDGLFGGGDSQSYSIVRNLDAIRPQV